MLRPPYLWGSRPHLRAPAFLLVDFRQFSIHPGFQIAHFAGVFGLRELHGILLRADGSREHPIALEHQRIVVGYVAVAAVAFQELLSGRAEAVDPQAVFLFVYRLQEPVSEGLVLRLVYPALENGVLDSLAEVFARGGDFSEPAAAFFGLRVYVVCDQDVQGSLLSGGVGYVKFRVASEVPGQ